MNRKEIHHIFKIMKLGQRDIAINNLYKNYNKVIINIAFSIVKSKSNAEKISQIVFMKVMQLQSEKIPEHHELNWLYTTTKNITIEYLRKQNNFFNIDSIYNIMDSQSEIINLINKDAFNNLINNIDDKSKEIVSMKIFSNFSFKEIGELLRIPHIIVLLKYYKSILIIRKTHK